MIEQVYKAIKEYINKNGYSPTMAEICEITGLKSKSSARDYFNKLRDKGYITYQDGKARTIKILKDLV